MVCLAHSVGTKVASMMVILHHTFVMVVSKAVYEEQTQGGTGQMMSYM